MTGKLQEENKYKIVLGTKNEDYETLLRIKEQLGDRFYVRNVDNALSRGFTVALLESDLMALDDDLRRRAVPMSDEGVERLCVSALYRFLPEQFVTDFVSEGKIWLSTFDRCQELEDKTRVDGNEGKVSFYHAGQKIASANVGKNAYLLCGSLSPFASGSIQNERCVYIQDLTGLVKAINKALRQQGVKISAIVQGPCIYTDHRVCLDYDLQRTPKELEKLFISYGDRIYFIKDALPNFMVEHEYRVVWLTDGEITGDGMLIQIDDPDLYVQAITIPSYSRMFHPPIIVANNHPYVIPPQMVAPNMQGKIRVV